MAITLHKILFFPFTIALFCSCNKQNNEFSKTVLSFDSTTSHVQEEKLIRDSIIISYYSKDSIVFLKYSNGDYKQWRFFNMNNVFFERRQRYTEVGKFLGIDSILTFSKTDTIFEYKSARRFVPLVQMYSYADCIYTIKCENNEYMTIKQSLVDTAYQEIFFYDKNYDIYKYIDEVILTF